MNAAEQRDSHSGLAGYFAIRSGEPRVYLLPRMADFCAQDMLGTRCESGLADTLSRACCLPVEKRMTKHTRSTTRCSVRSSSCSVSIPFVQLDFFAGARASVDGRKRCPADRRLQDVPCRLRRRRKRPPIWRGGLEPVGVVHPRPAEGDSEPYCITIMGQHGLSLLYWKS